MHTVGILYPLSPDRPPSRPSTTAFGRAAQAAATLGLDLLLGEPGPHGARGAVVRDDVWVSVEGLDVGAWLHRFPDGDAPERFDAIARHLGGAPVVNPVDVVRLCRDKLACQRHLEALGVPLPEVVGTDLAQALAGWGAAFLKPRSGAFGYGVRRVVEGDPLPEEGDWILQRAIAPPLGVAGVSLRVLVQREPGGAFVVPSPVARLSTSDPVVNHARGASVVPADTILDGESRAVIEDLALRTARALAAGPSGDDVGELGLDVVLDADGQPHLIEVNGKPRGRLEALATRWPERFADERDAAVLRPVRFAAWRAGLLHP